MQNQREFWQRADFLFSAATGILFLLASLIINYYAATYAAIRASNSVTDIILDNVPTVNTELIFVNGIFIFIGIVAWLLIKEPKRIPFALKSIALFVFIRSIFITLTHLAPSPDHAIILSTSYINYFTLTSDLFFSGHTGLPYLMALMFWKNRQLRIAFITASLLFGAAVLRGHLHYSIDVFAAFFITYGIFQMSKEFFSKDWLLFSPTV